MTALTVAKTLARSDGEVTANQDVDTLLIARKLGIAMSEAELIGALGTALAAPGAPTIGAATIVDITHVSVAFTAPGSDGGDTITSYTVTSSPGAFTAKGTNGSPIVVTAAFVKATAYTFTVTATNGTGTSAASAATAAVTPNP